MDSIEFTHKDSVHGLFEARNFTNKVSLPEIRFHKYNVYWLRQIISLKHQNGYLN